MVLGPSCNTDWCHCSTTSFHLSRTGQLPFTTLNPYISQTGKGLPWKGTFHVPFVLEHKKRAKASLYLTCDTNIITAPLSNCSSAALPSKFIVSSIPLCTFYTLQKVHFLSLQLSDHFGHTEFSLLSFCTVTCPILAQWWHFFHF